MTFCHCRSQGPDFPSFSVPVRVACLFLSLPPAWACEDYEGCIINHYRLDRVSITSSRPNRPWAQPSAAAVSIRRGSCETTGPCCSVSPSLFLLPFPPSCLLMLWSSLPCRCHAISVRSFSPATNLVYPLPTSPIDFSTTSPSLIFDSPAGMTHTHRSLLGTIAEFPPPPPPPPLLWHQQQASVSIEAAT